MKGHMKHLFPLLLTLGGLIVVTACAEYRSSVRVHPEKVETAPICSECHTDWQSSLDHTSRFARSHRFAALRRQSVCESCHRPSFCADCHADGDELKPSDKYRNAPWRELPHRGDYLTQHRIDGRLNPLSCVRCHGRNNDGSCRACHR